MKILYLLIAVLKFLGIAILLLLLLVLLLVIIILTVPIKYSVYLNKAEEMYVYTNIKWLYSIIGMDIIYNSGSAVTKRLKLFGRAIGPKKPKKLKTKVVKESEYSIEIEEIQDHKQDVKIAKKIKKKIKANLEDNPEKVKKVKQDKKEKKSKDKKSKEKKGGLKEKISQIQLFSYKKELLVDTISWIAKFLKNIAPSTIYVEVEIGKEDPADTGQLIAMVSALYPIYHSFANIVGNYEKECFYGKLEANGKITLGRFVYDLIKYIRTTSVKELIKFTRKNRKGKKNGRKDTK